MKRNLFILITLLLFVGLKAQPKPGAKDAINARKVSFLTKSLELTSAEAEKFWPVFNEYEQKKENIRRERIKARKKFQAMTNPSEKECEALIDQEVESHEKETELSRERHRQMKKILSMKKIAMLYKAEEDFKKILLKEACENMKNKKGGDDE